MGRLDFFLKKGAGYSKGFGQTWELGHQVSRGFGYTLYRCNGMSLGFGELYAHQTGRSKGFGSRRLGGYSSNGFGVNLGDGRGESSEQA